MWSALCLKKWLSVADASLEFSPNGEQFMNTTANGERPRANSPSLLVPMHRDKKNWLPKFVSNMDGKQKPASVLLMHTVKNTDTAEEKGYDAGKKVSGIKRHIAVDTQGLPHAIAVTTANVTDREGALIALGMEKENLTAVVNVLADGGYTGENFATSVKELIGAGVQIAKRNELHTFAVIPKRWVVERSFAWLEKCRRLWKNCERKINSSLQFVLLAFIAILLKRL